MYRFLKKKVCRMFEEGLNTKVKLDSYHRVGIIESVDSISRDERDVPLTQYITNA